MIRAKFFQKDGVYNGFEISGHAGFDLYGKDIVCASVSSAVQLTANGITEVLGENADVSAKDNSVRLSLKDSKKGEAFIKSLKLHLELLSEDYPGTIHISCMEV